MNDWLLIALLALGMIAVLGAAYYFLWRSSRPEKNDDDDILGI